MFRSVLVAVDVDIPRLRIKLTKVNHRRLDARLITASFISTLNHNDAYGLRLPKRVLDKYIKLPSSPSLLLGSGLLIFGFVVVFRNPLEHEGVLSRVALI
jgi:hypothetical protein